MFKSPAREKNEADKILERFQFWKARCLNVTKTKWQHKFVWEYKRGNMISYFLNNAAKTCSYGLKTSENIEIKHVFQSKAFSHLSNTLRFSYLSVFNDPKYFIEYWDDMMIFKKLVKNSIQIEKLTILTLFDEMIADMFSSKKCS